MKRKRQWTSLFCRSVDVKAAAVALKYLNHCQNDDCLVIETCLCLYGLLLKQMIVHESNKLKWDEDRRKWYQPDMKTQPIMPYLAVCCASKNFIIMFYFVFFVCLLVMLVFHLAYLDLVCSYINNNSQTNGMLHDLNVNCDA